MHRDDLPKGPARLVFREGGVTHIIQGPKEDVEQRLWQEVAVEELDRAEKHPMPDPLDDEPVDATDTCEA